MCMNPGKSLAPGVSFTAGIISDIYKKGDKRRFCKLQTHLTFTFRL